MSMQNKKILVFGKNGQVGRELLDLFTAQYNAFSPENTVLLGRNDVDLSDSDALTKALENQKPEVIINASAYTAVDQAETDRDTARAVNSTAPSIMAQYAQDNHSYFVHISTDYVFDGTKKGPYKEEDTVCPINFYGTSKAEGEASVMATFAPALVLRTSWVYAEQGSNFVNTMLRLGRERDSLSIVDDQIGAPTNAKDIAKAILDILPQMNIDDKPQLFHMTAQGHGSWYDFASIIFEEAQKWSIQTPQILTPIPSSSYPTPAKRPLNSRLDCRALTKKYGVTLPQWDESARDCLKRILDNQDNKKDVA